MAVISVFVIGDIKSERSVKLASRLDALHVQFDFIDAIFPNEIDQEVFNLKLFQERYGREPKLGEVGCTLSHRLAWKRFLNGDRDWCVILEDDAIPQPEFHKFLSLAPPNFDAPTVALLGHTRTTRSNLWFQRLKQPLSKCFSWGPFRFGQNDEINGCGGVGYVLNRSAAEAWLDLAGPYVVDDYQILHNVRVKVFHPLHPIIYEDVSSASQIGNRLVIHHAVLSKRFLLEICELLSIILRRIKRSMFG